MKVLKNTIPKYQFEYIQRRDDIYYNEHLPKRLFFEWLNINRDRFNITQNYRVIEVHKGEFKDRSEESQKWNGLMSLFHIITMNRNTNRETTNTINTYDGGINVKTTADYGSWSSHTRLEILLPQPLSHYKKLYDRELMIKGVEI